MQHASRTSYPTFLSFSDTASLQLRWAWRGLVDAFRWDIVISAVSSDPEIRANVYKSLLLNSLSLISTYVFDILLGPLVENQQKWLHRNVGWFYQILWLLPVVGVSFYLNSSWCSIVAKRTYILRRGPRSAVQQTMTYSGMLRALATSAYRGVMVFTSVAISFALGYTPYIGPIAGFIFLCWVDAYYCFEFVWIANNFSLSRRIRHLEERWAYYLTFGLPSSAICMWGSTLANAALFALVFPSFIIMAMHARPVPLDPYNPVSTIDAQNETIQHPSPFIPIRIPIFAPVLFINDWIVKVLTVGGGQTVGRNRALSDSTSTENAEEGSGVAIELNTLRGKRPMAQQRVHLGRRKLD
ncbi:hypothetical protein BDN71DRAFT_1446674 [Pleurotus eryngii]|uniref:Etoposide-induced protein 2.4-domain-containing protein n=1 Tax=Pleurotus eryngii TaxID=5323 RepID=A0A9P5ZYG8_PLEER|nr:hypothetical protein BDN71DRAFT_1446674 [Pleurotus eryngii]